MKNALRAAAAAAALGLFLPAAQAATTSNNFNVTVTLSSQCAATNSGTTTVSFGTYTAFQAAAATSNSVNLTFQCTRGFSPVSAAFDVVNGTAAGVGVVQGLAIHAHGRFADRGGRHRCVDRDHRHRRRADVRSLGHDAREPGGHLRRLLVRTDHQSSAR